jgi:hypothetical protein
MMPRVIFTGGPHDGATADLPFLPTLLIGNDLNIESEINGKTISTAVHESTFIYQLMFPNGENEPFNYSFRFDRPDGFHDWFPADQRPRHYPPKTPG